MPEHHEVEPGARETILRQHRLAQHLHRESGRERRAGDGPVADEDGGLVGVFVAAAGTEEMGGLDERGGGDLVEAVAVVSGPVSQENPD